MSSITVRQTTQKIVVDSATGAVSVISAGAQGPAGPAGDIPLTIGDTPPVAPNIEDLWINTNNFVLCVFYNDGDSTQWVEVGTIDIADIDLPALADSLVPYVLNDPDFQEGVAADPTPDTVTISTDTHTLTAANIARLTLFDSANPVVVTVPIDTFNDGDWFSLHSIGAGGVSLDTTGITVLGVAPHNAIESDQVMTITFTAPNTISIIGSTVTV